MAKFGSADNTATLVVSDCQEMVLSKAPIGEQIRYMRSVASLQIRLEIERTMKETEQV